MNWYREAFRVRRAGFAACYLRGGFTGTRRTWTADPSKAATASTEHIALIWAAECGFPAVVEESRRQLMPWEAAVVPCG